MRLSLIAGFLGGSGCEDDKPDASDKGHEVDEKPPAALAYVVHATDAH